MHTTMLDQSKAQTASAESRDDSKLPPRCPPRALSLFSIYGTTGEVNIFRLP